jgi:hypothetical protein
VPDSYLLPLAAIVSFIAGMVRGFTGFGTPLLMGPLLAIMFGPAGMVPVIAAAEIFISTMLVPRVWRDAEPRAIALIWLGGLPLLPLGTWLLAVVDPGIVKKVVALVVLFAAIVLALGWRYRGPRNAPLALGVGGVGGLLGGLVGFAGPPVLLYILSQPGSIARARANLILYFGGASIAIFVSCLAGGLIDRAALLRAAAITPVVIAGVLLGQRFYGRASEASARSVALAMLFVAGALGLVF